MITMAQLQGADISTWRAAATGWLNFANQAERVADDIRDQGTGRLPQAWGDKVGQAAAAALGKIANEYECAADIMKGAQMVLDGLAESVEVAQRELASAVSLGQWPVVVESDGTVHIDTDGQGYGDQWNEIQQRATTVENMIKDALQAADQADSEANRLLAEIKTNVNLQTVGDANHDSGTAVGVQHDASLAEVNLIGLSLPAGQSPAVVAAWWNGLTDTEKTQLQRAVPTDLVALNGIPDDVKTALRGNDGYDRMALVNFALDHANDTSIDKYGDDCTQFVSTALNAAGIPQSRTNLGVGAPYQPDWHPGDTGFLAKVFNTEASSSWINAQGSHDFMLANGSSEVPKSQAEPGDIVYFHDDSGHIYHSAVVTSVTPDGDILYTQHSPGRTDYSLNGRSETIQEDFGSTNVSIVRVKPNWS